MKAKMKETREKAVEALAHELADQQKHLFELRSQAVTEKLEDPSQLLKTRRGIARLKTILRERQLEEQRGTPKESPATPAKSTPKTKSRSKATSKATPRAKSKPKPKKATV